jgi:hypothetical protein
MSDRYHRRLRRYAGFSLVQLVVVAFVGGSDVSPAYATTVVLITSAPVFWAWGAFQADVAMNPRLQEGDRRRWRILLACLPGSMAFYWFRHVRVSASDA